MAGSRYRGTPTGDDAAGLIEAEERRLVKSSSRTFELNASQMPFYMACRAMKWQDSAASLREASLAGGRGWLNHAGRTNIRSASPPARLPRIVR